MNATGSAGSRSGAVRRWTALRLVAVASLVIGIAGVVVPLAAPTPVGAEALTPVVTGVSGPNGVATGPDGEIFVSNSYSVGVWSPTSTTVFGTAVPADSLTTLFEEETSINGIAFENGNLWVASTDAVVVLSASSGTVFGVGVTADQPTTIISSLYSPTAVAFDSSGDLFVSDSSSGTVSVLPTASGTVFGTSVTADTLATLASGFQDPVSLAFDTQGNLYISDNGIGILSVLPIADGTVFGTPVTADSLTTLDAELNGPWDLAFDPAGNLYLVDGFGVDALSNVSGSLFGTSVPADTLTPLNLEVGAIGIAFDGSGNLLMTDGEDNAVVEATPPSDTVTAVGFTGAQDNPDVTITGTGFGASAPSGEAPGCSATGNDYVYSTLTMSDNSQYWQAGIPGDCIGFNVVSWTNTQIVLSFGSWYTDQEVSASTELQPGDSFVVGVMGAYFTGTVPPAPAVTGVSPPSGPPGGTTPVTISGTGLAGASAVYFGSNPATSVIENANGTISAVAPAGSPGTVDVTVTTTWGTSPVTSADEYTYANPGQSVYLCVVPGLGSVSVPIGVTAAPSPPPTIDVGGTFQTTLGSEVTLPASAVNYYRSLGATSLTAVDQSTSENGLSSPGGPPSGAVDPSTQTAAADDLPQSLALSANTPVTYTTTYDPVTWLTGPGTGGVTFAPGAVDITVTYVVAGSPVTQTIACSPPSGVGTLGSTTVEPAPPAPTLSVPSSSPPVQAQVTAGSDDGWAFTVTNTSDATVKGLAARVTIGDGGTPPPFDLTAIAAAGTKGCSSPSAGVLSCSEANLTAGASTTINVLADTAALAPGTQVSGSALVTASNATSRTASLGVFELVSVPNGAIAVASPGIPLASSSAPLSVALAEVTLKLPKTKIPAPESAPAAAPAGAAFAVASAARASRPTTPPVVGVTLEPLASSTEPALCPPALGGCKGDIIQVQGNFSAYVNQAHPVSAVIEIYYGGSVPTGSIYMLKPSGAVVKLATCVKVGGGYITPCVKGKEKVVGSAGSLATEDTVYFTGNDPAMGRR
jgi:sugar lactone lactonase YvrE